MITAAFHAGVNRPRELTHDAALYRACLRAEERLREQGADIRRVILEHDLKPELPYFDESVHFPDFRIEYELEGRNRNEDVEVLTEHYRGSHASSRARAGFTCYRSGGRSGGRPFDPRVAENLL